MGYGPIVNGKQQPITRWENSWAYQEQQRRLQQTEEARKDMARFDPPKRRR